MTALPLAVSPDLRRRAGAVAMEVADRLRSPEPVGATARRARRLAGRPSWDGSSLLLGHPGVALLHATMSVADPSWALSTHAHLAAAAGGAGVDLVPAVVLHGSVHGGYPKLMRELAASLAEACEEQVRQAGAGFAGCDVVGGLAGTGRLLLAFGDDRSCETLHVTLRHLAARSRVEDRHDQLDAGLAHGVAGPLALMALAHDRGHRVDGMVDAMRAIADRLQQCAVIDDLGPSWPSRAGSAPETAATAWCDGTAGVARALHLAGVALGDPPLCAVAVRALSGVALRPWSGAGLAGPTVCHGAAGLLQVVLRVTERDPDPLLLTAAGLLAQRVLYDYDRTAPFGFRHLHRTGAGRLVGVDEPGLLQGAAGVALVLATFANHPGTVGPDVWDAPLLLA